MLSGRIKLQGGIWVIYLFIFIHLAVKVKNGECTEVAAF